MVAAAVVVVELAAELVAAVVVAVAAAADQYEAAGSAGSRPLVGSEESVAVAADAGLAGTPAELAAEDADLVEPS